MRYVGDFRLLWTLLCTSIYIRQLPVCLLYIVIIHKVCESDQVLYAGEGESRKPDENATPPVMTDSDKVQTIVMKVKNTFGFGTSNF